MFVDFVTSWFFENCLVCFIMHLSLWLQQYRPRHAFVGGELLPFDLVSRCAEKYKNTKKIYIKLKLQKKVCSYVMYISVLM